MSIVGIDIDGVVTQFYKYALEKGEQFFKHAPVNFKGYSVGEIFGETHQNEKRFWEKYSLDYWLFAETRQGFIEFILQLETHDISYVFITSRGSIPAIPDYIMQEIIKLFLSRLLIRLPHIIFVEEDKKNCCLRENISLFVEDKPTNILEISKDIPVIVPKEPYNEDIDLNSNICLVDSFEQAWEAVCRYLHINED